VSSIEFRVEVRLPSTIRTGLPDGGLLVVEEPVSDLGGLTDALDRLVPGIGQELSSSLYTFAVNDQIILKGKRTHPIRSGDRVEVMPIFAGGGAERRDGRERRSRTGEARRT